MMHLSRRERLGYALIVGLLLFAAGYVGAHKIQPPPAIVFETLSAAHPASRPAPIQPAVAQTTSFVSGKKTLAQPHSVPLNTASADQLMTLPGVGPALAKRIIDYRTKHGPFRTLDEVRQVKGIGPKKMGAIHSRLRL